MAQPTSPRHGFLDVVRRAAAYLEDESRVSLRALSREFDLDDATLDALVEELVDVRRVAIRDGAVLVSTRAAAPPPASTLPGAVDTECRELTILFCDLVGSTALSTRLDSEDYADGMRRYHEAATEVVTRFGGFVAQLLGDGLLVLFGYPEAQEDSAEQAVRAGLELVRVVERTGLGLAVRVGLHSGQCVVRSITSAGRQESLALGETPNIAARVQAVADAGAVLMSAATERLVAGWFVTESIGPHAFKGVTEPMLLHWVREPSAVRSRLEARSVGGLAPFVGRETEIDALLDRWTRAKAGTGQAAHISGEPGIGKSRLVKALRERLAGEPHQWLEGACSLYVRNTAFHPVIEGLLGLAGEPSPAQRFARLESSLRDVGLADPELLALLESLLSRGAASAPAIAGLSPEARRRRTIDGLADWLVALARREPVVAFVEDLHWCDPSTLELLRCVVERVPAAPLLLVTTARPEFTPGWLDADHTLGLHLERMADGQALAIVDGMLGSSDVLAGVRARIVERAEGIPLFVEELSQVVLDASRAPAEHAIGDIPASLQSLLLARLDRLGAAKPVAQVASVLGREFSHEMLLLVLGDDPDRRAGLDLERALGTLTVAGLLTATGSTATYAFRHSLLKDAAYQSLLKRTRRELHARVFGVLRARFPDLVESEPELAARHAEAAGMAAEAIGFYERAAAQAEARSAHEEALLHLNRALDVALAEPAGVDRDRYELAVRQSMSAVLFRSRGWAVAESVASAERMRELALSTGDRRSYAAAVLGLALTDYLAARFAPALARIEESIAVAGEVDATPVVIVALTVSANIAYAQGRFRDAYDFADRAASLYVPELHHREVVALAGDDSGVTAMGTRGWALFQLGYPTTGIACTQSAVGVATSLGHPFTLAQARLWELAIRVNRADDDLEGMATDLVRYCEAQKFPAFAGAVQGILGRLTGNPALVLDGVASAATTGSMALAPIMGCYLAEAQLEVGQLADALAAIDGALELAAATVQPFLDGHMLALKGEVILADAARPVAERRSAAESCFRRGIEIAGAQENRMFQLRAANCLARLLHGDGRDGEARALLAPLYGWFSEGFDTFDLREARRLLAELVAT